jgi:hypothetical protein
MESPVKPIPARKVLIVSPHFSPINAPDMQRVRMALPFLRRFGWEPVVLAVAPESIEGGVVDPLLEKTYPEDIRVIRVKGISPRITRLAGFGNLWLRSGRALRAAGDRLLRAERFDLAFFSTTQFDAFRLGPRWKAMFGLPYVLDYQDPWINSYYSLTRTRPPGGWLKFGISQWRARRDEPRVLQGASGVIAVSGAYATTLEESYPWFDARTFKMLPFGAAEQDFEIARSYRPKDPLVPFDDGRFHIVYVGRCGPDMSTSLSIVFRAFKKYLAAEPAKAERIHFSFIGTDYAPRPFGREWATPVAKREGIERFVSEHCYRVPYFDALYYLINANAILAVGSNDPSYSASKIYPYVLARRPMLIVFNARSPVIAIAKKMGCGMRFEFGGPSDIDLLADEVASAWFIGGGMTRFLDPGDSAFLPYTAESMSGQLAECFDAAVGRHNARP